MLSKLVGESGKVIGVDMTEEQLSVALEYIPYHTEIFGYKKSNVEFRKGLICLLYTSPSPRDATLSRMPSSA